MATKCPKCGSEGALRIHGDGEDLIPGFAGVTLLECDKCLKIFREPPERNT